MAYEELFLELAKVAQQVGYQIRSGSGLRVLDEFNYENRTIPLIFDFGATGNFRIPSGWTSSESIESEKDEPRGE